MESNFRLLSDSSLVGYGTLSTRASENPQREIDRVAPTPFQSESLIITDLHPEPKAISDAKPIAEAPEAVKKESRSVGSYIAQFFRFLVGLFFPCCMGNSDDIQPEPAHLDSRSSQRSGRVVAPPRRVEKKKGPAFPPQTSEPRLSVFIKDREEKRLTTEKEAAHLEYRETDVRIAFLESEIRAIREVDIPEAKARNGLAQLLGKHKNSKELAQEAEAKEKELQELRTQYRRLGSDLKTVYVQHPRFREAIIPRPTLFPGSTKALEAFPFQMFFSGLELKQSPAYLATHGLSRISLQFQEEMTDRLKSWSGQDDINPLALDIPSQAQLVLLRLAEDSDPLVMSHDERRELNPQTVAGTVVVNFVKDRDGQPVMKVEREVQTEDKKRYRWVETVRFNGERCMATRNVSEIK